MPEPRGQTYCHVAVTTAVCAVDVLGLLVVLVVSKKLFLLDLRGRLEYLYMDEFLVRNMV